MKENLQNKMVEILDSIQGAMKSGSDFVVTQLPDVAQSYIAFGRVWLTFVVALLLIVVIAAAFVSLRYGFFGKDKNQYGGWTDDRHWAALIPLMPITFGGAALIINLRELMLVWFAPKVWLLQEIAELIRKMT